MNHETIIISVILFCFSGLIQAQEWYAMSRHGECIALSKVTDRKELLKGLSTPEEIENKLVRKGVNYTKESLHKTHKGMLKFNVPSENLAMILVRKRFCKELDTK